MRIPPSSNAIELLPDRAGLRLQATKLFAGDSAGWRNTTISSLLPAVLTGDRAFTRDMLKRQVQYGIFDFAFSAI